RTGETPFPRESWVGPASRRTGLGIWLSLLCLTLLGYALAGKGAAYIGLPPLFVGEAVLGLGLVVFILYGRWLDILNAPQVWLLLLLAGWSFLQTYPYLHSYGADVLLIAAIWLCVAFALLLLSYILALPPSLFALVQAFRRFPLLF